MCINNKNIDMFLLFIHVFAQYQSKSKKKKKAKKKTKKTAIQSLFENHRCGLRQVQPNTIIKPKPTIKILSQSRHRATVQLHVKSECSSLSNEKDHLKS